MEHASSRRGAKETTRCRDRQSSSRGADERYQQKEKEGKLELFLGTFCSILFVLAFLVFLGSELFPSIFNGLDDLITFPMFYPFSSTYFLNDVDRHEDLSDGWINLLRSFPLPHVILLRALCQFFLMRYHISLVLRRLTWQQLSICYIGYIVQAGQS